MLADRLLQLSCNQHMFNYSAIVYQKATPKSGYYNELKYQHLSNFIKQAKTRKEKPKILWFYPPFSEHVKTNIGKTFFSILLEKHFPSSHRLRKICNKLYAEHGSDSMQDNRSILGLKSTNVHSLCNCRHKAECPQNDNYRKKAIIYKASISTDRNDSPKLYYGCCETEFKSRFYNHRQTFKNKQKRHTTELSKVFWKP